MSTWTKTLSGVLISVMFLLFCTSGASADFTGEVVGVIDGDTIEVLHNGKSERVRLQGIDAPEKSQAFGRSSKRAASELAFGKDVTVEEHGRDKYGRTLGEVILPDDRSLNRELVRKGHAWQYRKYSSDESLARDESEARRSRRGLWKHGNAVPPWEYRKASKRKH